MKILVLCDQGNNRSVTIAHQLKYWKHDVLSAGTSTNSIATLTLLADWADRIIYTEESQIDVLGPLNIKTPMQLWDIGPDIYPRPFNRELLAKVRKLIDLHRDEYMPLQGSTDLANEEYPAPEVAAPEVT